VTPDSREEIAQLRRELTRIAARLDALETRQTSRTVPTQEPALPPPDPFNPPQKPPPSLEERIGAQWLNRVGIIAVLFGVAYFLRYAFANNWIGPAIRILIGIACGVGVFLWSERFRRSGSVTFSHSLKAVALGVFYLSLWAAFQMYHLVPAAIAFIGMVLVTAAALFLSLRQNAQVLAAMALVGGLATPGLVSTGENQEVFLFSYLALLSGTAVLLSVRRGWSALALIAFIGTTAYYVGWSARFYEPTEFATTLVFLTFFFAVFLAASVLPQEEQDSRSKHTLFAVLLANAVSSFFELYGLFDEPAKHNGLFWALLLQTVVYVGVSLRTRQTELRNALIAIASVVTTAAIALRFENYWITLGWLIESAIVLAIAARSKRSVLLAAGLIALALASVRLVAFDSFTDGVPFLNWRALLFGFALVIAGAMTHVARRMPDKRLFALTATGTTLLFLIGLDREISFAILPHGASNGQNLRSANITLNFTRSALWMLYGVAAMALGFVKRVAFYRYLALALLAITICKVFVYDIVQLDPGYRVISFIALGVILLAVSYAYQRDWLKLAQS
jgi:uncharacterized membrane protein